MQRLEIQKKYTPDPENLLLILTEIQRSSKENYLDKEDITWVAEYLNITLSAVYGVVKYYSMFSTTPRGHYVVRVCRSPVCRMMGSDAVARNLESIIGIKEGLAADDGLISFEKVECLGQCHKAPSMMVNDEVIGKVTRKKIVQLISSLQKKP